ncbi:hypothetical protein BgiMline_014686 [Biomphalaria glabrata]|nr:hypothetical protein BgiMline_013432 [Biomphalaria glabrata]
MSDTRNLRTGSGWVSDIKRIDNGIVEDNGIKVDYTLCWCRKCQDSVTPSKVWWEFDVVTATHVVFDDVEARHTTLRLFYDTDDSPIIKADQVIFVDKNIKYDSCLLKGVTCNKNLGGKLKVMFNHYENIWWKVFNKYFDTRDRHKFNFIVSHPHGCCKQVSLGKWKDQFKLDDRTRLTYTTCTCPGSSGAHVHCLGYNWRWWSDLVHSGSLKSGLNYSGCGRVV